eukprot:ctg_1675.g519
MLTSHHRNCRKLLFCPSPASLARYAFAAWMLERCRDGANPGTEFCRHLDDGCNFQCVVVCANEAWLVLCEKKGCCGTWPNLAPLSGSRHHDSAVAVFGSDAPRAAPSPPSRAGDGIPSRGRAALVAGDLESLRGTPTDTNRSASV